MCHICPISRLPCTYRHWSMALRSSSFKVILCVNIQPRDGRKRGTTLWVFNYLSPAVTDVIFSHMDSLLWLPVYLASWTGLVLQLSYDLSPPELSEIWFPVCQHWELGLWEMRKSWMRTWHPQKWVVTLSPFFAFCLFLRHGFAL